MVLLKKEDIKKLMQEAPLSDKKRVHKILHPAEFDGSRALILTFNKGSYARPHFHKEKRELFILLQGSFYFVFFTDSGEIEKVFLLDKDDTLLVEVPINKPHTIIALEDGSTLCEISPGPHDQNTHKIFLEWAPDEQNNNSKEYLENLTKSVEQFIKKRKKRRILVTGSSGFIGKYLVKSLGGENNVFGISRTSSDFTTHQVDLTSPEILTILEEIDPEIIIHCAAKSNVDYCEENPQEAEVQNVITTKNLVEFAKKRNLKFIFISTDYVYSGEVGNYDETSETKPLNFYGETKLRGEKIVSSLENYAIIRTSTVFGKDNGKNFLMQILNNREEKRIPSDQISNPTSVDILVDYIKGIIEKDLRGIFIGTGKEISTRYEFAKLICKVFNLDSSLIKPITTLELKQIANRPKSNGTNSSKLRNSLDYDCPSIEESLKKIKQTIKFFKPN